MSNPLGKTIFAVAATIILGAGTSASAAPVVGTIDPYSGKPCVLCHPGKLAGPGLHGALDGNRCVPCHKLSNGNHTINHSFSEPKDRTARLCYECHPDQSRQLSVHAPVMENSCLVCHAPHSSPHSRLLKNPWPILCFSCHDKGLERDEQTDKSTAFRDNRRNLHYLHLRKAGISCLTCHQPHASSQERLLRTAWKSGKDQEKLTFRSTLTGGSCNTSCHDELSYSRKP